MLFNCMRFWNFGLSAEIQLVNKFGLGDSPIKFEASRPFLFYIKDEDTDALLFVGKVMDPADTVACHGQDNWVAVTIE